MSAGSASFLASAALLPKPAPLSVACARLSPGRPPAVNVYFDGLILCVAISMASCRSDMRAARPAVVISGGSAVAAATLMCFLYFTPSARSLKALFASASALARCYYKRAWAKPTVAVPAVFGDKKFEPTWLATRLVLTRSAFAANVAYRSALLMAPGTLSCARLR